MRQPPASGLPTGARVSEDEHPEEAKRQVQAVIESLAEQDPQQAMSGLGVATFKTVLQRVGAALPRDSAVQTAGEGDIHRSAHAVFPSVARFTRVCAYDRPNTRADGADRSTPRTQPHTVDLDVSDLHALMAAAHAPGPYVLVTHSYSGFIAELYARTYPKQIRGRVLVDPGTSFIAKAVIPATLATWDAGQKATSPQVPEGVEAIDAITRINAAPAMPKVPVTVLRADKAWRTDLLPPEATQGDNTTFGQWLASQDLLAAALGAKHVTATKSGHNVALESNGEIQVFDIWESPVTNIAARSVG